MLDSVGMAIPRWTVLDRYPELRRLFLTHLARFGSLAAAATHIRCSVAMVKAYAERNRQFAEHMDDAINEHRGKIEQAIYERAIEGVEEPKFGNGGQIGTVRKYSDQLLLAYAKRHIPEYREGDVNRTEVNVQGTVSHEHAVDLKQLSGEQRSALRLLLGEGAREVEVRSPAQIEVREE